VLRTALLFVRSAVRLVYAELPGPWRSASRSKHTESCVIVSLGGDRIVEHRRVQRAPRAPLTAPPPPPSTLLLLYAQPLVRIAALKTTAIVLTPQALRISLGAEPIPVPEPFPGTFRFHLHNRLTSALPATARPVIGCGVSTVSRGSRCMSAPGRWTRRGGTLAARSVEFGDVSGCVISGGVTCGHSDTG
jgi:hypothetical protein